MSIMVTRSFLDSFVGKNIKNICDQGVFVQDDGLHCAHFIGHLLGLHYGNRCAGTKGVTINVSDVLSHSRNFREFSKGDPHAEAGCLIYVAKTKNVNVTTKQIIGKRHVGIYLRGWVWHYENDSSYEQVVSYSIDKPGYPNFKNRYTVNCGLWVSDFPPCSWEEGALQGVLV